MTMRRPTFIRIQALLLAACGWPAAGCSGTNDDRPPASDAEYTRDSGTPRECESAEAPETTFLLRGVLEDAEYWACAWPESGSEEARFVAPEEEQAAVSGAPALVPLEWSGASDLVGRNIYFTYTGIRGYFVVPPRDWDNPLPAELFVSPEASGGNRTLRFAIGDGQSSPPEPNLGPTFDVSFYAIPVGSGDVQINLHWDTTADLDLHVFEPSDEEIFYAHRTSLTGGQLDLDSYSSCSTSDNGRGNENIYWPDDDAPAGEYRVVVAMWSDCGTFAAGTDTTYRVTVVLNRTDVTTYTGQFDESSESSVEVTRFTY